MDADVLQRTALDRLNDVTKKNAPYRRVFLSLFQPLVAQDRQLSIGIIDRSAQPRARLFPAIA